jgi:hypothetical protein
MRNDIRPDVGHRFTFQTDPAPGFDGIVQHRAAHQKLPRSGLIKYQLPGSPRVKRRASAIQAA